ncbi:SusC/RagA family TonB-linked outer membrane protein [Chitinophaga horti]|uniref:SusC/RagA family TonB-linked outer membrane protein n=1 Tax=Chitinophaga horti TaxID=2920382 RepID=A0ABY6J5M9_9BACT|nr:SusC/RagA family TonB-linked outer membrane protein [Chitinophaga horti]UYQ94918.1 SusC/RagA family TonB-linked outer membrane protein [Chitinophaga horti]
MLKNSTFACFLWVLLFSVAATGQVLAQATGTVTGRVTNDAGEPLPKASVKVKGTNTGTLADETGNFRLEQVQLQTTLVISYVNFEEKEIVVTSFNQPFQVKLAGNTKQLTDVVVIGYGATRRKEVASAVSVVSVKEAGATTAPTPSALLIGKAAGVQIVQSSGNPGADAQIIIRGTGSFKSIEPLYVIDGIQSTKGLFNTLSTQDIDNITILKDASSTAIYGSAAANGVVIVTTKKGRSGPPRITLMSQWGKSKEWRRLNLMKAKDYVDLMKDFAASNATTLPAKFSGPGVLVDSTDWQDQIFQSGLVTEHYLNINGGGTNVTYNFSANYLTQQSIVVNQTSKRLNLRLGLEETYGRFKLGQSLAVRYSDGQGSMANLLMAMQYAPYKSIFDKGIPGGYSNVTNVLDASNIDNPLLQPNIKSSRSQGILLFPTLYGEVGILKDLKFRSQVLAEVFFSRSSAWQYAHTASNNLTYPRQANLSYSDYNNYTFENFLSYAKTFGEHSLSGVSGMSFQAAGSSASLAGIGTGIANDNIRNISVATSRSLNGGGMNYGRTSVISYYGRANYVFREKYIINASYRRDGASNFGPDYRWGNFYGAGAAWRFSDEDFLKGTILSDGKLRAGWGRTGNNSIGNFLTDPVTYAGSPSGVLVYSFGANEAFVPGVTVNALATPDLRWEETDQTDIGLDLGFLQNRFTVSFDYYKRKSNGLLVSVNMPGSVGVGLTGGVNQVKTVNAANAQNEGFELTLGYQQQLGDVRVNVSANGSINNNKVLSLGKQFAAPIRSGKFNNLNEMTYTAAGGSIGAFYGYRTDHVARDAAEVDALNKLAAAATNNPNAVYQVGLKPGDFIYKDLNGDGLLTDQDQEILGSPIPKYIYGFNAGVDYKGFDLNVVISGIAGVSLLNGTRFNTHALATGHNVSTDMLDRWRQPGDVASLPRAGQNATGTGNLRQSDWWVEDGSYMRLRNLTLGYKIPVGFTRGVLKSARIYVAAQNLFTITDYAGYDPEVSVMPGGNYLFSRGIDLGALPQPRTFLAGLEIGF